MEEYLKDWIRVIEEMRNDNTYKAAWGKAIIECILLNEYRVENNKVIVEEHDVSYKMMRYYWNQTFFFNLSQGNNPVIEQEIRKMIEEYIRIVDMTYPVWFDKAERLLKEKSNIIQRKISRFVTIANQNVAFRFMNIRGKAVHLYELNKENRVLLFEKNDIDVLKDYGFVLIKLINFKWVQLLERYNTSPNISKKISTSSNKKVKRSNLTKYKNFLLKNYHTDEIIDFYTGEKLLEKEISLDHVIPWSFMYSDDIWNLVFTSKSNNSKKGQSAPSKNDIEKLNKRNSELLKTTADQNIKMVKDLEYAIKNNLTNKYLLDIIR